MIFVQKWASWEVYCQSQTKNKEFCNELSSFTEKIYIPSKNPILYIDSYLSLKSARAFNDDWCAVKLKVSLILFPILTLDQIKSSLSTWPVSLADPHEILLNCTPRHFFLSTHYLLGAWHFLRQKNTGNPDVQMSKLRSRPRAHNWSVAEMGLNSSSPWGVHNEATCFLGGELLEKQIQSCPQMAKHGLSTRSWSPTRHRNMPESLFYGLHGSRHSERHHLWVQGMTCPPCGSSTSYYCLPLVRSLVVSKAAPLCSCLLHLMFIEYLLKPNALARAIKPSHLYFSDLPCNHVPSLTPPQPAGFASDMLGTIPPEGSAVLVL